MLLLVSLFHELVGEGMGGGLGEGLGRGMVGERKRERQSNGARKRCWKDDWFRCLMICEEKADNVLSVTLGIVRAPLLTTLMQVASRFLLVWGIVEQFPATTGFGSPAYSTMLIAWSVTEVIRYSFFAVNLSTGRVPGWLMWLRYNTFFVLYPLGIGSECWLVWRAMEPARSWNLAYEYALRAVLFVYIPGESSLTSHLSMRGLLADLV